MKRLIWATILFIGISTSASAQLYKWSVGIRAGGDMSGLVGKYQMNPKSAIEAMFSIPYKNGAVLTGLYEYNLPVIVDKVDAYFGGGAHIGGYSHKFVFGLDVIAGLEYKVPNVPFAISLDYKPALNIIGHSGFYWSSIGLGLKFAF